METGSEAMRQLRKDHPVSAGAANHIKLALAISKLYDRVVVQRYFGEINHVEGSRRIEGSRIFSIVGDLGF